jgi:hypothetical protein
MSDDRHGPGPMNHGSFVKCELQGCTSTGQDKITVGKFQVYDGNTPTMTRPAQMCRRCVNFAKQCGMTPKPEKG